MSEEEQTQRAAFEALAAEHFGEPEDLINYAFDEPMYAANLDGLIAFALAAQTQRAPEPLIEKVSENPSAWVAQCPYCERVVHFSEKT